VATIAGAVFLGLGWLGASHSSLTTEQIPYLASGAVAGLFALGAAATLWLSADLRDEWRKLDEIYQFIQARDEPALAGDSTETVAETPAETAETSTDGRRPARDRR